jgi:hypothetical protein
MREMTQEKKNVAEGRDSLDPVKAIEREKLV